MFIRLTDVDSNEPIIVNTDGIIMFESNDDAGSYAAWRHNPDGPVFLVKESIEEIWAMLQQAPVAPDGR